MAKIVGNFVKKIPEEKDLRIQGIDFFTRETNEYISIERGKDFNGAEFGEHGIIIWVKDNPSNFNAKLIPFHSIEQVLLSVTK